MIFRKKYLIFFLLLCCHICLSSHTILPLTQAEDELNAADGFERIFPTSETFFYFEYFEDDDEAVPYSERLMDAYETEFGADRGRGRQMLESYCKKGAHLS